MQAHREIKFLKARHRLTQFCIPEAVGALKDDKVQTTAGHSFNLGEALQSHYPLLDFVFRFLDERTLKIILEVSTMWQDFAQRQLDIRSWPTWITYNNKPKPTLFVSNGFGFNNVSLGLVVYNPKSFKLDKCLCVHTKSNNRKVTFADYLAEVALSEYCAIACSSVSPIIDMCHSVFQGIFIPCIPNVTTKMFEFSHSDSDLSTFINGDEELKACLIFTKKYNARSIEVFLDSLLKGRSHKDVAMGGGIINSKKSLKMPENHRLRERNLLCVAFLQRTESNFRAYSAVIVNGMQDGDGFTEELIRFRETTNVLYNYGIIFRFCCSAKIWKEEETELIYRYFPDYIVFGMNVEGEIGWNTFDVPESDDSPKAKKRKCTFPETLYGFTSVLVLITWGNKRKTLQ